MPTAAKKDIVHTLTAALETASSLDDDELEVMRVTLEAEAKRRAGGNRKQSGTFLKASAAPTTNPSIPPSATSTPAPGTAAHLIEEVLSKEGFRIEVPGASPDSPGFPAYNFQRRMRGDATVQHWTALRWARFYGDRKVRVLLGDGRTAPSNMRLDNLAESYRGSQPREEKF